LPPLPGLGWLAGPRPLLMQTSICQNATGMSIDIMPIVVVPIIILSTVIVSIATYQSPSCRSRMKAPVRPRARLPLFVKQRRAARGPGTPSVSRRRALPRRRGAYAKPWWSFPSTRPTPLPSLGDGMSSAVHSSGAPGPVSDPFFLCHGHALVTWLSFRLPNLCFQLLYAEAVAGRRVTLEEAPGRKT
jgi:hypothetical protein